MGGLKMRALALLLLVSAAVVHGVPATAAADCSPSEVGVDPALADTTAFSVQCRAVTEVFQADDTLITAISVWSPPTVLPDYTARTLFVTGAFDFQTPDNHDVIYASQPLVLLTTDPVNPIEYRWVFQP